MTNELTVRDMSTMQLGEVLARSGFFSDAKGAAQAVVKVLAGRELGFGPIASMTGVHVIQGKIALGATLMASAIKRSGRYNYRIKEHTAEQCAIEFFEQGQSIGVSTFTMDDAKSAGLDGKAIWKQYPENMLFARAISNGARWHCPDIFGGPVYTPDEMGAEVDGATGEILSAPTVTITELPESAPDWENSASVSLDYFDADGNFTGRKAALAWARESGVFATDADMLDAYNELKTAQNWQTSEDMTRNWRAAIERRLSA